MLGLLVLLCKGRRRAAARGEMISTVDNENARAAYEERLRRGRALPDRLKQHLNAKHADDGISLMPIIVGEGVANVAIDGGLERKQSTTHI